MNNTIGSDRDKNKIIILNALDHITGTV